MKKTLIGMACVALIAAGCGMLGKSGPTWNEVLKSNKGLMDSVRTSLKNIEAQITDTTEVNDFEKAASLPVPPEFDNSSANNMEIVSLNSLYEFSNGTDYFYRGDLYNALDLFNDSSVDTSEVASDYVKDIFNRARKYRYLCVYREVQYDRPNFTSPEEFEPGYMDMEVFLFDLKTSQKLGAFRFIAESDSVINYEYDQGAGDAIKMAAGNASAESDIQSKCRYMIVKGLKEITGADLKVWVGEENEPYFVTRGSRDDSGARER